MATELCAAYKVRRGHFLSPQFKLSQLPQEYANNKENLDKGKHESLIWLAPHWYFLTSSTLSNTGNKCFNKNSEFLPVSVTH
jgi:hypothetical protein